MKKNIFILLIISALLLAACGSTGTDTNPNTISASQQADGTTPNTDSGFQQADGTSREITLSTELAIGTLKLEGTEFAVASDQASSLLPLWQVLRSLTESDAAAQEEINAIIEQIQETMTSEQLQAIEAMGLTNESTFSTMQELGLVTLPVNASGTPQPRGDFQGGGDLPGRSPGAGGGPGGGFGGDGSQLSPDQIATAQARRAENGGGLGGGNRLLASLTEAVISLLESK